MDADRFDAILRSLSTSPSRRHALRMLAGSALGGLLTFGALVAEGKKGGKRGGRKKKKKKNSDTSGGTTGSMPPCIPNCPAGTECGDNGCKGSCGPCADPKHCSSGKCCDPNKEKSCATDPRNGAPICDCCEQGTHLSCEFDPASQLTDCVCCTNGTERCGGVCCPQGGPFPTCFQCFDTGDEVICDCMG